LVDNAVKFSPDGGPVLIALAHEAGEVTVTFDDEGVGLDASEHERVFDRFYQCEPHTTRSTGGCGIGLYLARRVVASHGGRIWIESKPGPGLRVKVALPVSGPQLDRDENT